MFNNSEELVKYIADEKVEYFDIRFCDLPGVMHHLTVPASTVDQRRRSPPAWRSTARPSRASSPSTSRT